MKKYFVLCLLVSSLQAMEQEELEFQNQSKANYTTLEDQVLNAELDVVNVLLGNQKLTSEQKEFLEEKAAKKNKFAEIMQKSHKNSDSMTSDDYEFLSAYEKEHAAEREQKIKQEKDRPVVALEQIAKSLETIEATMLLYLYNKIHNCGQPRKFYQEFTAKSDSTFSDFARVIRKLEKMEAASNASTSSQATQDSKDQSGPHFPIRLP